VTHFITTRVCPCSSTLEGVHATQARITWDPEVLKDFKTQEFELIIQSHSTPLSKIREQVLWRMTYSYLGKDN